MGAPGTWTGGEEERACRKRNVPTLRGEKGRVHETKLAPEPFHMVGVCKQAYEGATA